MKVVSQPITVRKLYEGYQDSGDAGVSTYGGLLDIRPPYQREFVYKPAQQVAVLDTVLSNAPLSIIYWAKREADPQNPAEYEVLDGQQRTLSIMRFVTGAFKIDFNGVEQYFANLPGDIQDQILDYELLVYVCDGTESEKLAWFRRINIAGEVLNQQELLNAVFSGPWLTSAKSWFSKSGGAAAGISDGYAKAEANRQGYLALALKWLARKDGVSVEDYMGAHAHDLNANELRNYFTSVIEWARAVFPQARKELKSVDWALLYDQHGARTDLDPVLLEAQISSLMADEDVTKKYGVYEYVLTGSERGLSIRAFSDRDKRTAFERQQGRCAGCNEVFLISEVQGDHVVPWSQGGKTISENCEMLCKDCHDGKTRRQVQLTAHAVKVGG